MPGGPLLESGARDVTKGRRGEKVPAGAGSGGGCEEDPTQSRTEGSADAKRPLKKLTCEKRTLAKLEIQGANICGSASSSSSSSSGAFSKELTNTISGGTWCLAYSPVLVMMLQSEGKEVPKMSDEMQADQANFCAELSAPDANSCFPKAGGDAHFQSHIQEVEEEKEEEEGEEGNHRAEFSDSSEMEPEELQSHVFEMDNSAFLNEDSNQPLPVDRFFGSVAFLQDIPAAPLARATASRREFRKLHFIAKDDDDEDGEDVA